MENKFKLRLDSGVDLNSINSATVLCVSSEYLIDLIKDVFKKYNKNGTLNTYLEEFSKLVDKSYDVAFSGFLPWIANKSNAFVSMMDLVKRCDEKLNELEVVTAGQVLDTLQVDLNEYIMSLGSIVVDHTNLDLGNLQIKKEYVDSTIEQLTLMNESHLLSTLSASQIEMTPIDFSEHKNLTIEKKINTLDEVTKSAKNLFDGDYDKLLDVIMSLYTKFYKLSNEKLTDGEKTENARKLIKDLQPHKKLLDKLEDKLTKGNELKRQLLLHKNKLIEVMTEEGRKFDNQLNEDINNADIYKNKKSTLFFSSYEYINSIDLATNEINKLEEDIANRYKTIDLLMSSLKSSIPTEGEMNKLSAIPFKFQELANKQENYKSTTTDDGVKIVINSLVKGFKALVVAGNDLKELYMRNSLVSATFKTVDAMLDFAESENKGERVKNMLFVNNALEKYLKLSLKMAEEFSGCRKIANDTIRNIAMMMCKPYTRKNLDEMYIQMNMCYLKMDKYIKDLEDGNREEINLIKEILSL